MNADEKRAREIVQSTRCESVCEIIDARSCGCFAEILLALSAVREEERLWGGEKMRDFYDEQHWKELLETIVERVGPEKFLWLTLNALRKHGKKVEDIISSEDWPRVAPGSSDPEPPPAP